MNSREASVRVVIHATLSPLSQQISIFAVFLCLVLNTIGLFAYAVVNMAYVDAKLGGSILVAAVPTVAVVFYLWMCVVSHYRDLAQVRAYRDVWK